MYMNFINHLYSVRVFFRKMSPTKMACEQGGLEKYVFVKTDSINQIWGVNFTT